MALVSCYECEGKVSAAAKSCPHCGAPKRGPAKHATAPKKSVTTQCWCCGKTKLTGTSCPGCGALPRDGEDSMKPNPTIQALRDDATMPAAAMSVEQWLVIVLIGFVPIVNIVMYFVWGFGDRSGNINRQNYSRAALISFGALVLIGIVMTIAIASIP